MLSIKCADGKNVEVSQEMRAMSKLVEESLLDNADEKVDIEANTVNEKEMKLIKEYVEHHKFAKKETDIDHPLVSKDPKVYIKDDFDREFITKLDLDAQAELLMAANFFDIPALFELCCASIASFFKGKDFDKIKGDFGL